MQINKASVPQLGTLEDQVSTLALCHNGSSVYPFVVEHSPSSDGISSSFKWRIVQYVPNFGFILSLCTNHPAQNCGIIQNLHMCELNYSWILQWFLSLRKWIHLQDNSTECSFGTLVNYRQNIQIPSLWINGSSVYSLLMNKRQVECLGSSPTVHRWGGFFLITWLQLLLLHAGTANI